MGVPGLSARSRPYRRQRLLEENYDAVGNRPTLDLSGELDDGFKPVHGPAPGRRVKEFLAARKNRRRLAGRPEERRRRQDDNRRV